jgi:hypothetical protein
MTLPELTAAVDMLRARGVSKYTDIAGGGFVVEFFPSLPDVKAEPAAELTEKCACGHALYEHNAGLCIQGCDPIKCAPEKR